MEKFRSCLSPWRPRGESFDDSIVWGIGMGYLLSRGDAVAGEC